MIVAKGKSKGQVTIPKKVGDRRGRGAGEDVGFEERESADLVREFRR